MSQAVVSTGAYFRCYVGFSKQSLSAASDECTYITVRFPGARRCCRGSGGPSSARLTLQGKESPGGWGPARCVLRSSRSELGARRLACWWWCSLFSPCATCQSAFSMSWKGDIIWLWEHVHFSPFMFNNVWRRPLWLICSSTVVVDIVVCISRELFLSLCRVFGTFKNTNDRETVYAWFTFSHWLIYANSAANPIIYNFLSGKFFHARSVLPSSGQFDKPSFTASMNFNLNAAVWVKRNGISGSWSICIFNRLPAKVDAMLLTSPQGSSAVSSKQPFHAVALAKDKTERRGRGRAQTAANLCQLKLTTWTMCLAFQIKLCSATVELIPGSESPRR